MDNTSEFPKGAGIFAVDKAERFFKCRLQDELQKRGIAEPETVMCADYIAETLEDFVLSFPKDFYAADYFFAGLAQAESGESEELAPRGHFLVRGGQTCFVICVLFPGYHQRRLGNQGYFAKMGVSFFYRYYTQTGAPIPLYMAERFNRLVPLTRAAIRG
jgi:hypothetical protein